MLSNVIYRLISFADYSNIKYSKDNLEKLLRIFNDKNYSVLPLTEERTTGEIYRGISVIGDAYRPIIYISSGRIEIVIASEKKEGFDETEKNELREQMVGYLDRLYTGYRDKIQDANRLAWVSEYVYFEISKQEMHKFRRKFQQPIDYFEEKSTIEFMTQYVAEDMKTVASREEKLNVISNIKRWYPGQGDDFVDSVDGYSIELDINTDAENKKNRFCSKTFRDFVTVADKLQREVIGDII